jgi:outer membrane murein-binding lipoprotein Lpp
MKIAHFSVVALPVMLLVGCGSQAPQSVADQKAQLCTDLARFNTSVATLKSMSPSSTVSDFRAARDEVKANFEQVKLTAQSVQEAKVAELESAYQGLDSAVQNIPETATLQQAMDSVSEQVVAVEDARAQMNADLNCP